MPKRKPLPTTAAPPVSTLTSPSAKEAHLAILLADLSERNEEIRTRVNHEHTSYITLFTTLITVIVAAAAADHFGQSLANGFKDVLPLVFLLLALFLLWLPLDAINEQLRIRVIAVYIERELRPKILKETSPGGADFLTWEPFQARIMLGLKASRYFVAVMLGLRAIVGYAPSIAAVTYFLFSGTAWSTPEWSTVEIVLLACWAIGAMVPLLGAIYLARSRDLSLV